MGDVLMCGGQNATQSAPTKWKRDTWTWNGADWTEIITSTLPASQVANDAAYDELRQRVVLASGNGSGGSPTALISEFDSISNDWVQRPLDPGIYKCSRYFAAYVPALGVTLKASGQPRPLITEAVDKLAASIREVGLIQPISVRCVPVMDGGVAVDGYQIVAGHHRVAAARALGWTEIDAIIVDVANF